MFDLSPDFDIRVRGQSLRATTAWGDLTASWSWGGGSNELSFTCATTYGTRIASLLRSAPVELSWAGWPMWVGTILEPEWNGAQVQVTAEGAYKEAARYTPMIDDYLQIDNPVAAVLAAQSKGLSWTVDPGIPYVALHSTTPYANVGAVLDDSAKANGVRWAVNTQRVVYFAADPTEVSYHVRAGAADLGIASDAYASNVVLIYNSSDQGTVFGTSYPDLYGPPNVYEQTFGRKEVLEDITDREPMTDATAAGIAQSIYERSRQKPGFTNGLNLGHGEILDARWQPIHPARVAAEAWGKVVRVHGVPDMALAVPYTDFVVGSTSYTAGQSTVTVNPVGLAARDPESVLTEIIEALVKSGVILGDAA